ERLRYNWVLEERSGATGIVVAGHDQHCLAMTNFAHRRSHFSQSRLAGVIGEELLQVGIANARLGALTQCERYLEDDVPIAFRSVEDAGAIGETAIRVRQRPAFHRAQIERPYFPNGLSNFLAIGADVLHRRAANRAGNSAKTFQAR